MIGRQSKFLKTKQTFYIKLKKRDRGPIIRYFNISLEIDGMDKYQVRDRTI